MWNNAILINFLRILTQKQLKLIIKLSCLLKCYIFDFIAIVNAYNPIGHYKFQNWTHSCFTCKTLGKFLKKWFIGENNFTVNKLYYIYRSKHLCVLSSKLAMEWPWLSFSSLLIVDKYTWFLRNEPPFLSDFLPLDQ